LQHNCDSLLQKIDASDEVQRLKGTTSLHDKSVLEMPQDAQRTRCRRSTRQGSNLLEIDYQNKQRTRSDFLTNASVTLSHKSPETIDVNARIT
jgi:hypothetical protein